jgi:hypothetical protein
MPDKLEQAVADITRDDLVGSGPKTEFLQFRVSKSEKESLRAAAERFGFQGVSDYVMTLHRLVEKKLSEE